MCTAVVQEQYNLYSGYRNSSSITFDKQKSPAPGPSPLPIHSRLLGGFQHSSGARTRVPQTLVVASIIYMNLIWPIENCVMCDEFQAAQGVRLSLSGWELDRTVQHHIAIKW